MDLSIPQIEYLKALLDEAILETCDEFEYPCYFSHPEITPGELSDLEKKDLIAWYDGWNITDKGEKAYHDNKKCLPFYQSKEES